MQRTTAITPRQADQLTHMIREAFPTGEWRKRRISLHLQVQITIGYLRTNVTEEFLGQIHGLSQPTISRIICYLTPVLALLLEPYVPDPEHASRGTTLLVDGTLCPAWSWQAAPELYSGKHHTTGHNVQVVADLAGRLVLISDPLPGRTHDAAAFRQHRLAEHLTSFAIGNGIGDKGYQGLGLISPDKKPINRQLRPDRKKNNKTINRLRAVIERVIANIKTWRLLHTDYRRPLDSFPTTLEAIRGVIFFQNIEPL